jgi:hypothetical protein
VACDHSWRGGPDYDVTMVGGSHIEAVGAKRVGFVVQTTVNRDPNAPTEGRKWWSTN